MNAKYYYHGIPLYQYLKKTYEDKLVTTQEIKNLTNSIVHYIHSIEMKNQDLTQEEIIQEYLNDKLDYYFKARDNRIYYHGELLIYYLKNKYTELNENEITNLKKAIVKFVRNYPDKAMPVENIIDIYFQEKIEEHFKPLQYLNYHGESLMKHIKKLYPKLDDAQCQGLANSVRNYIKTLDNHMTDDAKIDMYFSDKLQNYFDKSEKMRYTNRRKELMKDLVKEYLALNSHQISNYVHYLNKLINKENFKIDFITCQQFILNKIRNRMVIFPKDIKYKNYSLETYLTFLELSPNEKKKIYHSLKQELMNCKLYDMKVSIDSLIQSSIKVDNMSMLNFTLESMELQKNMYNNQYLQNYCEKHHYSNQSIMFLQNRGFSLYTSIQLMRLYSSWDKGTTQYQFVNWNQLNDIYYYQINPNPSFSDLMTLLQLGVDSYCEKVYDWCICHYDIYNYDSLETIIHNYFGVVKENFIKQQLLFLQEINKLCKPKEKIEKLKSEEIRRR